jgi:NAD-dependent deacetylase sirtuin 5
VVPIHGSLFETECNNINCEYAETNHWDDSIITGLAIPDGLDIAHSAVTLPHTREEQLPHCPRCKSLMRPSVVLFSEKLYQTSLDTIEEWFEEGAVDLLLIVGTSAVVHPAASYIHRAWDGGARIAVVNTDAPDKGASDLYGTDHWYFHGDAAKLLPELLEGILEY